MKKPVSVIITDLDDTVWDWLSMWYDSFNPYLERISKDFNINLNTLKQDFKRIHQKYKTTEASYVYNELTSISEENKKAIESNTSSGKSILHEYYSNKKHSLRLCKDVKPILENAKANGTMIIGFTESNAFFTKYRIKHLDLDGLFDIIYAPIDTGVPPNVYQHYDEDFWEPTKTEIRYLSQSIKKPAPEILEIIIKDIKANKNSTIYIGDKINKDISMANDVGIESVHAQYGHIIEDKKYNLLKEVTHWSDKEVSDEIISKKNNLESPVANYVITSSFKELEKFFYFINFDNFLKKENKDEIIKIWTKSIDVQQHFNDLELRIRNYALTIFTFLMGGIGYTAYSDKNIIIKGYLIPFSALLSVMGIIVTFAFFYMDKYWYHRLLKGAVIHSSSIEKKWKRIIPELNLTTSIGEASPQMLWGIKIGSNEKFYIFYGILVLPFILFLLVLMLVEI